MFLSFHTFNSLYNPLLYKTSTTILLMSFLSCVTLERIKSPSVFICPHEGCGRRFHAQFSLNRHSIIHSETKRFSCKYCGKGFSLGQYLREHQYRHTKELPYECGVAGCTKRFRQAGKLSLHRKTHPEYVPKKYNYSLNKEKRTKARNLCDVKSNLILNHNEPFIANIDNQPIVLEKTPEPMIEQNINPKESLEDEAKVSVQLPLFPGLQDLQDHTLHSPSMKANKVKDLRNAKSNNKVVNNDLDSLMKIIINVINNPTQENRLINTQFSTLDLFSLVNDFKH